MNLNTFLNHKLVKICFILVGVWFFFRYIFTLIAPFVFAFLLITLCYPCLQRIQRRIPVRKKFLAVGMILPLILLLMGILWAVIILGGRQLEGLPAFCTELGEKFQLFFHQCCCGLDGRFGWEGGLSYIITFIKAQGVILLTISVLCSIVLSLAGVAGGIMFGILAGVLDVLPFIGTGIVLVPLSVWQLINGQYGRMAVCLVLYGVCILTRELLEPKLIGRQIGVAPVFMLLAVYAGIRLFGVGGIIKGPLALIVIVEIWKVMNARQRAFDEKKSFDYD